MTVSGPAAGDLKRGIRPGHACSVERSLVDDRRQAVSDRRPNDRSDSRGGAHPPKFDAGVPNDIRLVLFESGREGMAPVLVREDADRLNQIARDLTADTISKDTAAELRRIAGGIKFTAGVMSRRLGRAGIDRGPIENPSSSGRGVGVGLAVAGVAALVAARALGDKSGDK